MTDTKTDPAAETWAIVAERDALASVMFEQAARIRELEAALRRIGNISAGHPISWAHSIVREVLPDFVRDTHVG